MKKSKIMGILSITFLLAGCSQEGNSTSSDSSISDITSSVESVDSSSSEDDGIVTFSDAYDEIAVLQKTELANASSTTYRYESSTSRLSHITEQTYTNYTDGSTSSAGTYTYKDNETGEVEAEDTFNTVATTEIDTYEIDGVQTSYNMFVQVTDYKKNLGKTYDFQDSASKVFIINSEADVGNLEDGEYILAKDFAANASCNLTAKLANFIANNAMSSYYVTAKGFTVVPQTDGSLLYSMTNSYSYTEDGVITKNTLSIQYTMDAAKEKLLTCEFSNRIDYTNEDDEADCDYSIIKYSGALTYGEKQSSFGDDVINPDQYFLTTVLDVKLMARDRNWNTVNVDKTKISQTCTKIYGFASSYSPTKAMDLQLAPLSSSNEDVVKYDEDEGVFEIVGVGTTNLKFSYYRKVNGVYKETFFAVNDVTIIAATAESISWGVSSYLYQNYGLEAGETYTWKYSVSPSEAPQNVTVTSSDPDVLEASVDALGTVTLKAKKEGEATITLTSTDDENVSASKSFYVLADSDYTTFLTGNTFQYSDYNHIYVTMKFNSDGSGTAEMTQYTDSTKTEVKGTDSCTFTWTLDGTTITFKKLKIGSWNIEEGIILRFIEKDGKPFGFVLNDEDNYAERGFVVSNN